MSHETKELPLLESDEKVSTESEKGVGDPPPNSQEESVPTVSKRDKQDMYRSRQNKSVVLRLYQKYLVLNDDMKVATLEGIVMFLSFIQLQWSYRSSHWREKRACANRPNCLDTLPANSFAVSNVIRAVMALLSLLRLFIRLGQVWRRNSFPKATICRIKMEHRLQLGLELLYTALFPYPFLETFIPGIESDVFLVLSLAVLLRPCSWSQWLYYPYPVRPKQKVTNYSKNLDFSYRQFILKKILDDSPWTKLLTFYITFGIVAAYLLHVLETMKGKCSWEQKSTEVVHSEDASCDELYISDSFWIVITTFFCIGFGDISLKSRSGQILMTISAFTAVVLNALFFSISIKKLTFSTMEARVHAFLYRMKLYNKKEMSAIMAVQAAFRYNKTQKQSLIWHRGRGPRTFYRPLSEHLPNEVKRKDHATRFQQSLKQILKHTMDDDPLNAFSKHIEVVTAALGTTFVDMIALKKVYDHQVYVLEQQTQQARRARAFGFRTSLSGQPIYTTENQVLLRREKASLAQNPTASPSTSESKTEVSAAWEDMMQRKCEATMHLLEKIETTVGDSYPSWKTPRGY